MKKSLVLFLCIILIASIFLITLINSQVSEEINPATGLPKEAEKVQEIGDKVTDERYQNASYLREELWKIIGKSEFIKPVAGFYQKISPVVDPLSKYTLGIKPELSWLFFLTLVLWIAFVIYIFRITSLFKISSNLVYYSIVLILIALISISGTAGKIADFIIKAISIITIWWVQLIIVAILIIGLVTASIFSKSIQELAKSMKEKQKKEQEDLDREKLAEDVKLAERFRQGLLK